MRVTSYSTGLLVSLALALGLSAAGCGGSSGGGPLLGSTTAASISSSPVGSATGGSPALGAQAAPAVTAVTPATCWNDDVSALALDGTGLAIATEVRLVDPAGIAPVVTATGLVALGATRLEVTLPAGLAPGSRQVVVITPGGASLAAGAPTIRIFNALDPDLGGGLLVGWRDVALRGASGDTPAMRVYYPALAAANNAAPDPSRGPYPIVAYGHGFKPPVISFGIDFKNNAFVAGWLASYGYVVACPDLATNNQLFGGGATGQSNSTRDADDLVATLDDLTRRGRDPQDGLFGLVDETRAAIGGHSRGGDGALIAAAREATRTPRRIRAVFAFGPPGTDSRNNNVPLVFGDLSTVPLLLIGSTRDAIAPLADQSAILAATRAKGVVLEVVGGSHSLYKDNDSTILGDGTAVIPLATQQAVVRRHATAWLGQLVRGQGAFARPWLAGGAIAAADPRTRLIRDTR